MMVMSRLERLEAMWPGLFLLEAGAQQDGGQMKEADKGHPQLDEVNGRSLDGELRGRIEPLKAEVRGHSLEKEIKRDSLKAEVRGHPLEEEIRRDSLKAEVRGHPLEEEVRSLKLDPTELSLLQQIIMARTGGIISAKYNK
jgi:hypothetical protein